MGDIVISLSIYRADSISFVMVRILCGWRQLKSSTILLRQSLGHVLTNSYRLSNSNRIDSHNYLVDLSSIVCDLPHLLNKATATTRHVLMLSPIRYTSLHLRISKHHFITQDREYPTTLQRQPNLRLLPSLATSRYERYDLHRTKSHPFLFTPTVA